MKKLVSVGILVTLLVSFFTIPAKAIEKPRITSFTFTPNDIELTGKSTLVSFELVAEHPHGILNQNVQLTVSDGLKSQMIAFLSRTDNPVDSKLTKVTFRGTLDVPRNVSPGVYNFSTDAIRNGRSAGYDFQADELIAPDIRNLVGAKKALLIRTDGDLNFAYETILGPAYDATLSNGITYLNPDKYRNSSNPIWKAEEEIDLENYFEAQVPGLAMKAVSNSPAICQVKGLKLTLLKEGNCDFHVYTDKTSNYSKYSINQTISISNARIKPVLTINSIATQDSTNLPKSIRLDGVYSASAGWVFPKTLTPEVCLTSTDFVQIVSGGICRITYQTAANANYKASDLYTVTFEITRSSQTIDFLLPSSVKNSSNKISLESKASSGGLVSFSAQPSSICRAEGDFLVISGNGDCEVTASQAGSKTVAPISVKKVVKVELIKQKAKRITCTKGSKSKRFTLEKCPRGWKPKLNF